ncbi:flagellar biosynthetic protein FliO [Luminiphilus sp.]|jgi:flagellar protein FliO/FliZ|nr:flagellar biosynthetic protein FliO [Luminiphilus sp.]
MRYFLPFIALLSMPVSADEAKGVIAPSELFTGDYLLQVVGSFVLVICVLLAVLLLLKRFNGAGSPRSGQMRVIASLGLGQRERAVLIEVGNEQFLVGVAPGSVNMLHALPDPVRPASESAKPSFIDVWKVATGKQGGEV